MNFYGIARQNNLLLTQDPIQRMANDLMLAELERRSRANEEEEEEEWIDYEEE